ncbi:MAG: hypothetical protein HN996_12855, partial [Opitutae bacterium]|nr:hypothetical protein [Opitutae bacterium]
RMAYVTESGKVVEYNANNNPPERVLLQAPEEQGPKSDEIWRVYDQQNNNGKYLFVTRDAVWRYGARSHLWEKFMLNFQEPSGREAANINIEFDNGVPLVSVTDVGGAHFVGFLEGGEVKLDRIFTPQERFFAEEAGALLDVQEDKTSRGDNVWRFVFKDKIKIYRPYERRWDTSDIQLGETFDDVEYKKLNPNDSHIVLIEASNGKDIKWRIHGAGDVDETIHSPSGEFSEYKLNPDDRVTPPLIDEEATIWRLDKEYKVIRMPYIEGEPFEKELEKWPTPFYIIKDEIRAVYRWQDRRQIQFGRWDELLIFESVNGLRVYRPSTGEEIRLPQVAENFVGVSEIRVRNEGTQLWVKNKEGYLVLDREDDDSVKGSNCSGIKDVAFDAQNNVWGLDDADWKLYESNSFVDPRHNKKGDAKMKVFVRNGVPVTAVDDDGYIYYQKERDPWLTKYTVRLPPKEILHGKIHNIVHDNAKGHNWWVLTEDALYHLLMVNVRVPLLNPAQLLPLAQGAPGRGHSDPMEKLRIKGLPILAVQKRVPITPADFNLIRDAGAGEDDDAEGIVFCFNQKGVPRSLGWHRKDGYAKRAGQRTYGVSPKLIRDEWEKRKLLVKKLDNDRDAYDPIYDMGVKPIAGTIFFIRPSGELYANDKEGMVEGKNPDEEFLESEVPQLQPALNAGWLIWDRINAQFMVKSVVNGVGQIKPMRSVDLIKGGRLFFEEVESLLSLEPNKHWSANSFGVIEYPSERLQLDNRGIAVQFVEIDKPITSAHGRFVSGQPGMFEYRFKAAPKPFKPLPEISLLQQGTVRFEENIINKEVVGRLWDAGGKPRVLFHDTGGFVFDANRRSLAYSEDGLLVQSDAGIHLLLKLTPPVDAAMSGRNGVLVGEENKVYLKVGENKWYALSGPGWRGQPTNPSHDRVCFDNPTWKWELRKNKMKIDLNGGNVHRFDYLTDGKIGFSSDELKDATAHKGLLYVMTEGFFEAGVNLDQLGKINGPRAKPLDTDSLQNLRERNGDRLIRKSADAFSEWNPARTQFDPLNGDPYANVTLAEYKNIRFRHTPGMIHKELNLENLAGAKKWVEFGFGARGRFPFDEINSIASYRGQLYMGTDTGVQVYNKLRLDLNGLATHLMTSGVKQGGGPEPVQWVGQPADPRLPDSMVAMFSDDKLGTVETNNGQQWTRVPNPVAATKARLRAKSAMMLWSQNRMGGVVQGVYSDEKGAFDFLNPLYQVEMDEMVDGRLPHDHIRDFIDFESDSFTVWETQRSGKMVTQHEQSLRAGIGSNDKVRNFHFDDLDPVPLLRVDEPFTLVNGVVVKEGVYLKV